MVAQGWQIEARWWREARRADAVVNRHQLALVGYAPDLGAGTSPRGAKACSGAGVGPLVDNRAVPGTKSVGSHQHGRGR